MKKVLYNRGLHLAVALLLGVVAGLLGGEDTATWGTPGRWLITAIKTLAGPLLFFSVLDSISTQPIRLRDARQMFLIMGANALIALSVGLVIAQLIKPGFELQSLVTDSMTAVDLNFSRLSPRSPIEFFAHNTLLSLVLLAVVLGIVFRLVNSGSRIHSLAKQGTDYGLRATRGILKIFIAVLPIAIFGVVAKIVGEHGIERLSGLLTYVGACVLGLGLQIFLVYHAWLLWAGFSLKAFWRESSAPLLTALGASSSLATLPTTLDALRKMKISDRSARLSACVGTNFNNDGILLYETFAVIVVAQAYGMDLTLLEQLGAAAACLIAGLGIAGVPEAGLISLTLVISSLGLPVELLPMLLSVDWILSRARALTNVFSDLTVAVVLDSPKMNRAGL